MKNVGVSWGVYPYLRRTHAGSHDGEWVRTHLLLSPVFTVGIRAYMGRCGLRPLGLQCAL